MSNVDPVIELLGLTVRLGKRTVLDDLSASFKGRALGLLGPNGAGKSTLLNTLLGFYTPFAGAARIFGFDSRHASQAVRALMGYMPENEAFIASMTGVHFVRYMAELSGLPPRVALERAHELFVYVGLGEARYRKLGTYSVGMKQTAKLAQALVHGPKLLFLDEPTNGLDPAARQRMIRLIQEIRDGGETRLVVSSHLLHDVEQCCDEILILKHGRIRAHVNLEEQRRRNQKYLELDTSSGSDEFLRAVTALGCECASFPSAGGGNRLRLVMPENVEVRVLYELAAQQGVLVRRMNNRPDSLEEIFMDAMRENGADVASSSATRADDSSGAAGAGDGRL
jgi:ABC-2 type transport system ATP-binding protein